MCGIIGVSGRIGALNAIDPACLPSLRRARDLMASRGPDGAGDVTVPVEAGEGGKGGAWLGQRRLSIIDLSDAGQQPMWSDCGRYAITYNGEVYNSVELRAQLERAGRRFRSTCDTEVIVNGFAEWGESVLDRLHGMFAFGIWDKQTGSLFLARDRTGMKPLYYAMGPQGIAFASDARALTELGLDGGLNPESVALYFVLGYVPSPFSIWHGISKLPAGFALTWSLGGRNEPRAYWQAPEATGNDAHSLDRLEELIDTVVKEHLLSDVPVGIFLSGGIDSSLIASSAKAASARSDLSAVTVGFPGSTDDEAIVAGRTAAALDLEWTSLPLEESNSGSYFDRSMSALDEPIAFSAVITQMAVSELAAKRYKVVLSGDGGDEAFGGYKWYSDLDAPLAEKRKGSILGWLRKGNAMQRFAARSPLHRNLRRVSAGFAPEEAADLVQGVSSRRVTELVDAMLERHDAPDLPLKRRLQRLDLMTFCADVICPKVDRTGMAVSLEVRPPLLDHRIVEFGISAPVCAEFDSEPKAALREILRRRNLSHLLDEPKRGFSLKGVNEAELIGTRAASSSEPALVTDWRQRLMREKRPSRAKIRAISYLDIWLDRVSSASAE